eukprot:m.49744 g.49744  ORF g.49744 m.49744 type:complete len:772 (+) comp21110_c0_seq1:179-2494(+)
MIPPLQLRMTTIPIVMCIAAIMGSCAINGAISPISVWVSDTGSDDNSGTSPSSPLNTISAGLLMVQRLKATTLRVAGFHRVNETLFVDTGTAKTLTIDAWPDGAAPTISGGAVLPMSTWTRDARGFFVAEVGPLMAKSLVHEASIYVGDSLSRRTMVRTETLHWSKPLDNIADQNLGFIYSADDIDPSWSMNSSSLARWRINVHHSWVTSWHTVKSIDPKTRTIRFNEAAQMTFGSSVYCSKHRWSIEGVPELPLVPGTWRISLDVNNTTFLHYAPVPGETFPADVVVPVVSELFVVQGQPAPTVNINNLVFMHSATTPCGSDGGVVIDGDGSGVRDGVDAGGVDGVEPDLRSRKIKKVLGGSACDSDEANGALRTLSIRGSPNSVVSNVTFRDVGGYGLGVTASNNFTATRVAVLGAGAGGISISACNNSIVSNTWVKDFGRRQPAGVGIVLSTSQHAVVEHCDISGGLYNGLAGGGTNDAAAYSAFRFNRIHGNGRESEDGICDFGGIHVSNHGSLLPGPSITDNIFFNITAFANGGAGVYCDVSSVGMIVERNLVYDVSYSGFHWNVNPGVLQVMTNPMVVRNNVFILDRENAYYAMKDPRDSPAITWHGYSPAFYEKNVHLINTTTARSRGAWWGGKPCASEESQISGRPIPGAVKPQTCSWDFGENLVNSTFGTNVYFNASSSVYTNTFGGGCQTTKQSCGTPSGECSCRSFEQWQTAVPSATTSLTGVDPELQGPLRLVTSPQVLALGIEPLTNLATVGPNWSPQ